MRSTPEEILEDMEFFSQSDIQPFAWAGELYLNYLDAVQVRRVVNKYMREIDGEPCLLRSVLRSGGKMSEHVHARPVLYKCIFTPMTLSDL